MSTEQYILLYLRDTAFICKHQIFKYRRVCKAWNSALQHKKERFNCKMDDIECRAWFGDNELIGKMDALVRNPKEPKTVKEQMEKQSEKYPGYSMGSYDIWEACLKVMDDIIDMVNKENIVTLPAHGWIMDQIRHSEDYFYIKFLVGLSIMKVKYETDWIFVSGPNNKPYHLCHSHIRSIGPLFPYEFINIDPEPTPGTTDSHGRSFETVYVPYIRIMRRVTE
jgi:hypothetical protein